MKDLIIAISMASAITSISILRFRFDQKPQWIAPYFCFILALEWAGKKLFLDEHILGYEIAFACFIIALLFLITLSIVRKLEKNSH